MSKASGFFDLTTEFDAPKICRKVRATSLLDDVEQQAPVCGYEFNMGRISRGTGSPCFHVDASEILEGAACENGRVRSTDIHGLFDQAGLRRGWLNRARGWKGLQPISLLESELVATQLRAELNRWSDQLEKHVNHVNKDTVYSVCEGR